MKSHGTQVKSLHPFKLALSLCLISRHLVLLPKGRYSLWTCLSQMWQQSHMTSIWVFFCCWKDVPNKQSSTSCVYNSPDCWREGNIQPSMKYINNANFYVCLLGCVVSQHVACPAIHPENLTETRLLCTFFCASIANPQKALMGHQWESVKESPTWSNTWFVFYQEGRCFVKTTPQPWHLDEFRFGVDKKMAKI